MFVEIVVLIKRVSTLFMNFPQNQSLLVGSGLKLLTRLDSKPFVHVLLITKYQFQN